MSLIQDLGARLRTGSDELPTALVAVAIDRLRTAADLLFWVRQASVDPVGVPQLASATEHAEQAAYALRVAQDALARYLTTLGLGHDTGPTTGSDPRTAPDADTTAQRADGPAATPLRRWWQARIGQLAAAGDRTDAASAPSAGTARAGQVDATGLVDATGQVDGAATGSSELLGRVAAGVRAGDRDRLHRELAAVQAPVGLGLSVAAPPVLHRLAGDLLGHPPRPEDLPRLHDTTATRVRDLLPGLPATVVDTLLARVCRVPEPAAHRGGPGAPGGTATDRTPAAARTGQADADEDRGPAHPADAAVAAGVLAGVLLDRLGRDPATLHQSTARAGQRDG